jgi:hypothetical protein
MTADPETTASLPVRRHFDIDERGVGLRATWWLSHGFVNISLWRVDQCTETFHLTPAQAVRLVSFLVEGLGDAAGAATVPAPLSAVAAPAPARRTAADAAHDALDQTRTALAAALTGIARRVQP